MTGKLYRSNHDRMIAGICGGIAEYFRVDSNLVRLGFILIALATGIIPAVITYLIGCAIIPETDEPIK